MSDETKTGDELFCWRDSSLVCGPTCVAWETSRDDVRNTQCRVLNNNSLIAYRLKRLEEAVAKR